MNHQSPIIERDERGKRDSQENGLSLFFIKKRKVKIDDDIDREIDRGIEEIIN